MRSNLILVFKIIILSTLLQFQFSHASERVEADQNKILYRVIPFERYMESQKVPPDLFVNFKLKCFQTFIKLIREDLQDPIKNEVTILIGGLVSEKPAESCSSTYLHTEYAGSTFSGRTFKVEPLR